MAAERKGPGKPGRFCSTGPVLILLQSLRLRHVLGRQDLRRGLGLDSRGGRGRSDSAPVVCGSAGLAGTAAADCWAGGAAAAEQGPHGRRRGGQRPGFAGARLWNRHPGRAACDLRRGARVRLAPERAGRRRWTGRAIVLVSASSKVSPIRLAGRKRRIRPVAGVDHQPPIITATVDHRDRVDEAAPPGDTERRKPALTQHRVNLMRRQQSRTVARASTGASRGIAA